MPGLAQIHALPVEHGLPGLQLRECEQVFDEKGEPVGVLLDFLQKPPGYGGIVHRTFAQRLDETLDERERRAQFVAHVGDEFLPRVLQLLEPREIVEDKDGALRQPIVVEHGRDVHLRGTALEAGQVHLHFLHLALGAHALGQGG